MIGKDNLFLHVSWYKLGALVEHVWSLPWHSDVSVFQTWLFCLGDDYIVPYPSWRRQNPSIQCPPEVHMCLEPKPNIRYFRSWNGIQYSVPYRTYDISVGYK